MKITKILFYDIVCPHCGTKIRLSRDEYEKYKKKVEDYSGSTVTCQLDENEEGKCRDIVYVNFDCPVCEKFIPITADEMESDRFGFKPSKNVTPFYDISEDVSIDEYINKFFCCDEDEVENEEDSYSC